MFGDGTNRGLIDGGDVHDDEAGLGQVEEAHGFRVRQNAPRGGELWGAA
ncbi:hypothetical protein ACFWGM_37600 [Streptomyces roseolus]